MDLNLFVKEGADVRIEVSPESLEMFAESVAQRTIMAYKRELEGKDTPKEETYLGTSQVRGMLNVCDGTLNLWAKRGYLVPVKVGMRNMYALSDVNRIRSGNRNERAAAIARSVRFHPKAGAGKADVSVK